MKNLVIVRGVSGSGKTTFAHLIAGKVYSADDFFYDEEGDYHFDARLLSVAHSDCQHRVGEALKHAEDGETVVVANTFTTERELEPYYKIAESMDDVVVFSVVAENRHGGKSVHNVPAHTLERQESRLRGSLKFTG